MRAKSREVAVAVDVWHKRLEHIGERTIKTLAQGQLVDGMDVKGSLAMTGKCEDCLFGKQTARPYDEEVTPETTVLKRVHIDLWGEAPVKSAGGAKYFMSITDDALSYRKVYFLGNKLAVTTLEAFKFYHVEAERQTGQKLKIVHAQMVPHDSFKSWGLDEV